MSATQFPAIPDEAFNIDEIDFDKIMSLLSDKDKEIFSLFYVDRLTTKQISAKLDINENTIKSRLKICRDRLRSKYGYMFITIIAVLVVATGVVFGKDIINFILDMFNLRDVGYNNDNITSAIKDRDWIQNVDMEYIELDDNYSIKVDYLLYDDMNLYMIFDLQSKSGFDEYDRFSISDLTIKDENDKVIIATQKLQFSEQLSLISGYKNITSSDNNIQELLYSIANGLPNMERLKIAFSEITLYKQNEEIEDNNKSCSFNNIEFEIPLDDKFVNKSSHSYSIISKNENSSFEVERAMYSDTGFYAIIKSNIKQVNIIIEDNNKNIYACTNRLLNIFDADASLFYYFITADIQPENCSNITLKSQKDNSQKIELFYK